MTKKSNKKKNNQFSVLQTDTESDGSVKGATTEPSAIRSDRISPRLSKGKESPSSNDNDHLEEVLKGLKDAQDDPKIRAALDDYDRALAFEATLSKELADRILQEVKSKMFQIYSAYQDRLAREAQELKELWLLFDAAGDQAELEAKSKILEEQFETFHDKAKLETKSKILLEEQFVTVYDKVKYIASNSEPVHQEMNEALMDYESAKLSSDLAAIEEAQQRQRLKKLVDDWQSWPTVSVSTSALTPKAAALIERVAEERATSDKTKKSSDFQVAVQDAQPEDVDLERVGFFLERLVFAAELEQAHIEEHLADDGKSFYALHGAVVH